MQESRCCPYPMMRALASLFLSAGCAILVCSTWLALNYLGLLGALGHQWRIGRWDRTCWVTYGTASKAGGSCGGDSLTRFSSSDSSLPFLFL